MPRSDAAGRYLWPFVVFASPIFGGNVLAQDVEPFASTVRIVSEGTGLVVTGQLVDSESNAPLVGGIVTHGSSGGIVDGAGRFRLNLSDASSVTDLGIEIFGYRAVAVAGSAGSTQRFYMTPVDVTHCEMFGLGPEARERRVRIALTDASTNRPLDAQVWIRLRSLNSMEPVVAAPEIHDGVIYLPKVDSGLYHLTVEAVGYRRLTLGIVRLRPDSCFGVERLELSAALEPRTPSSR